jgi:hypothetical protein
MLYLATVNWGAGVQKAAAPKGDLLDELFSAGPTTTQSTAAPTPPVTGSADPFAMMAPVATVSSASPYGGPSAAMAGATGLGYNVSYGGGPTPYQTAQYPMAGSPYGGATGVGQMGATGQGVFSPTQAFPGGPGGMGQGAMLNSAVSAPAPPSAFFSPTSTGAAVSTAGQGDLNTLDSMSSAPSSLMHSVGSPMAQGVAAGFTGAVWTGSVGGVGSGGGAPKSPLGGTAAAAAAGGGGFGGSGGGFASASGTTGLLPGSSEEWRLLGDVQQWHNALLIKDKV